MNLPKMKNEKGFTIVELLIVIVVIGILAAIIIVAYNGITDKAHNTAAKETASTLVKKITAYQGVTGVYPTQDQVYNKLDHSEDASIEDVPAATLKDSFQDKMVSSGSVWDASSNPQLATSQNGDKPVNYQRCDEIDSSYNADGGVVTYWQTGDTVKQMFVGNKCA